MNPKSKIEIRENLASVETFLSMQSALVPGEDTLSWAAECLRSYIEGREKSLDHAFGLCGAENPEPKPVIVPSDKHNDWIATALRLVISKTPKGKDWPVTKDLADIGRFCGLGSGNNKNKDDDAIASELKRVLAMYDSIAIEKVSKKIKITEILDEAND